MLCRFLILVIYYISISCSSILQDAEYCCPLSGNSSALETDNSDYPQNINLSWFAIADSEAAPILRTIEQLRPAQRTFDKRKLFIFNKLIISFTTNAFKHLAIKRLLLCHLNNLGGSLLHFLCKLSL